MTNYVVHVFNSETEISAQPFVVCSAHLRTSEMDYANSPRHEVRVLGETSAECYICYKRDRVVRPLSILERYYHEDKERYGDLSLLAHSLGYQSLEDAFMQLAVQRKLDADDRALLEGRAVVE